MKLPNKIADGSELLKSDYFRIEIKKVKQMNHRMNSLKSDYFRIEI